MPSERTSNSHDARVELTILRAAIIPCRRVAIYLESDTGSGQMRLTGRSYAIAFAALLTLTATAAHGQTTAATLQSLLAEPVQSVDVTSFQLQQYLIRRIIP